jgi:hypothetical protein
MDQLGEVVGTTPGVLLYRVQRQPHTRIRGWSGKHTWRRPENPERLLRISDVARFSRWQAYGNSCLSRVCLAGSEGIIGAILHIKPRLSVLHFKPRLSDHQGNKRLRLVGQGC